MAKKPVLKIKLLEELYLQLVAEIAMAENELVSSDQITMILSDEFIFEVKFKKKKKDLYIIRNEQD